MDVYEFGKGMVHWHLYEYLIHRFVYHNPWEDKGGYNLHSHHHRHPEEYNDYDLIDAASDLSEAVPYITAGVLAALSVVKGPRKAASYIAGVWIGIGRYELQHIRAHNAGPRSDRERRLFKQHLIHHFKDPKANFGVTTEIFDKLFGTYREEDVVAVPAHMAPKWLLDNPGAYPEYKIIGLERMAAAKARREEGRKASRERAGLKPYPAYAPKAAKKMAPPQEKAAAPKRKSA